MILLWIPYAKTWVSGEGSDARKGGRKGKRISSNDVDRLTVVIALMGTPLEDLRDQLEERLPWRKSIFMIPKS